MPFIHDDTVITGRSSGAAEEFSMELVRTLFDQKTAENIKQASCQR
ncbi:MAG: hypothetical protein J1D88_00900 [Treponema sp.]|nr:hypothetical protein [Treponema sp.]